MWAPTAIQPRKYSLQPWQGWWHLARVHMALYSWGSFSWPACHQASGEGVRLLIIALIEPDYSDDRRKTLAGRGGDHRELQLHFRPRCFMFSLLIPVFSSVFTLLGSHCHCTTAEMPPPHAHRHGLCQSICNCQILVCINFAFRTDQQFTRSDSSSKGSEGKIHKQIQPIMWQFYNNVSRLSFSSWDSCSWSYSLGTI